MSVFWSISLWFLLIGPSPRLSVAIAVEIHAQKPAWQTTFTEIVGSDCRKMSVQRVPLDEKLAAVPSLHLSDIAARASHALLFSELSKNTGRHLPHFYVLGAAKAGTTELFDQICQHPSIDCSGPKEYGVWTEYLKHLHQTFRHHTSLNHALPTLIHRLTQPVGSPRIFGDGTPENRNGWPISDNVDRLRFASTWHGNTTVVRAPLPHLLKLAHPAGVPLIVILREPVQRAWSHYRFIFGDVMHLHPSGKDFDALVHAELTNYLQCERDHGILCAFGLQNGYSHATRYATGSGKLGLHVGLYAIHLHVWRSYHGKQLLPLCFEDFINEPATTLQRVYAHLGLAAHSMSMAQHEHKNPSQAGTALAMSNHTTQQLHAFYAPHNKDLRWLMPKMATTACNWLV